MTDKKLFTEAIAKMTELAEKKQRVTVERDESNNLARLGFSAPQWSIEGVLTCDDPANPADPENLWVVVVGWSNVMPWDGASVTFKTANVVRLEDRGSTLYVIVS